ncbi:hypothetical protein CQW23_22681 [Capsicum baccatum]|uniref:Uncharacterized protein n=1 Tax=Capsicum baccatum TaxID=33114 RepID=A0A2G2W1K1_CAPBA|nr:hypothetical protein CQW23_22681 [Capsicum baccatum]
MLISGAKGSKILLTTRSDVVAEVSGSVHQHKLGDLSKEDAWTLFGKMTFEGNKESKNSNLVEIGKEIVRKCGGIPLAISYNYLARHLKICFTYCPLFPKDFLIQRSDLIDMWIAQGFIQSTTSNRDDVEDVANSYFMDLLRRSFFQETEEHEFPFFQETELDSPHFYKMHDLIHDLAKEVAGFCRKCQKLPLLWKLSSLQSLELRYLNGLEGYDDKFMLPSNTPIDECYFSSLKRLELEKINEKILKQILCPPHHPSPLCNLKDLSLDSFEGLATMQEDVFKDLRELPTARVVQRRGNAISGPGNLSTFSVVGLDKIMSLPIRLFSGTLKSIDITECPNFATIPDWIGDLIALNRLAIDDSPMLKSLPEGMQSLTAFQKLIVIGGSSILKQRFKKEVGEDWPKIAHVPTVDIDDDWN